ncbi:hypothetical protein [Bosea sp. (in: a-proteobacteria)]|uniref:hypothetical protein n=1 Tax=Bosea sp. (in: a-proteobacteria) TaxID=1871050 RepID=UPI001AD3D1F0|nr:hypothetical protein [Bosea sp. (in: a-proteobacteria)]MBN9441317.1 hypothetical protein [Bosea sp. (in: a-proteobacteria)]
MLRNEETVEQGRQGAGASALLLLQAAAAQARIGPFAARERATPQSAAALYRRAACLARAGSVGR